MLAIRIFSFIFFWRRERVIGCRSKDRL